MARLERRIFRLNDEMERIGAELDQARSELEVHRHLAADAARDAAVYDSPLDRDDLREITADVARFERLVAALEERIGDLGAKREKLLRRLD